MFGRSLPSARIPTGDAGENRGPTKTASALWIALILGGLWVFHPSMRGTWLWDDHLEIEQNPDLRSAEGLIHAWTSPSSSDYLPFKATLQWLEWQCWQEHIVGYHAASLAGHLMSAWILAQIITSLGYRGGFLAAVLFVVHPLTVESVSWISEQKNTLSLPFALAAFWCFARFDQTSSRRALILSWAFFLAAMLCKSSVVMLPVVILMYSWWKYGKFTRSIMFGAIPLLAVSFVLGLVTIWFQQDRAIGTASLPSESLVVRGTRAAWALSFYVGKVVWPQRLSPIYGPVDISPVHLAHAGMGITIFAAMILLWIRRDRWGRMPFFVASVFILNLLPILGLFPMAFQKISWVSDHFAYVALTVPAAVAGVLIIKGCEKLGNVLRIGGLTTASLLVLLLAQRARTHARLFTDEETFWLATLRANPQAWPACNNLGNLAAAAGRPEAAAAYFKKALELEPDEAATHNNLGNSYRAMGRQEEALAEYLQALKLRPEYPESHYNLAGLWRQKGNRREAATEYEAALRVQPQYAEAWAAMADLSAEEGNWRIAIERYRKALSLQPGLAEAHNNLGMTLAEHGQTSEAVEEFKTAIRLKSDYGDAIEIFLPPNASCANTSRTEFKARLCH